MKPGEIAVAQTPTIDMLAKEGPDTFCLSFWYLAYGHGVSSSFTAQMKVIRQK